MGSFKLTLNNLLNLLVKLGISLRGPIGTILQALSLIVYFVIITLLVL
jgi:hypothetical protein